MREDTAHASLLLWCAPGPLRRRTSVPMLLTYTILLVLPTIPGRFLNHCAVRRLEPGLAADICSYASSSFLIFTRPAGVSPSGARASDRRQIAGCGLPT